MAHGEPQALPALGRLLPQQLRQLRDIDRDPPRLVLGQAVRRLAREVADGKAGLIAIELRGKRSPHVTLVVQHSRNNDLEI